LYAEYRQLLFCNLIILAVYYKIILCVSLCIVCNFSQNEGRRGFSAEDESYLETDDQESFIRTDDEEINDAEWEDPAAKHWVNR